MKNILRVVTLAGTLALSFTANSTELNLPNGMGTTSKTSTVLDTTKKQAVLININTATEKQLTTLKGIGAKKAKAIIEYREINGDFSHIEELKNVKGIGKKLILKLTTLIEV
jgi:competence protein ComEA